MEDTRALTDWIQALSAFPARDCLVHFTGEQIALPTSDEWTFTLDNAWRKKLKIVQETVRETQVNPLALAGGFLEWTRDNQRLQTALFFTPIELKRTALSDQWTARINDDSWELNPYVRFLFAADTSICFDDITGNLPEQLQQVSEKLLAAGISCTVVYKAGIDLFHPDRFAVLRDLRLLEQVEQWQPSVRAMLGEHAHAPVETIVLPPANILPVDADQEAILQRMQHEDVLVQGPPGTGKSHLLTLIIGKVLQTQQRALVVSEKKSALEVVHKKLTQLGLGDYVVFINGSNKRRDWYQQVHRLWDKLAVGGTSPAASLNEASQRLQMMQQRLERLKQKDLLSGVSFWEFKAMMRGTNWKDAPWIDLPISLADWKWQKAFWHERYPDASERMLLCSLKPQVWEKHELYASDLRYLRENLAEIAQTLEAPTWESLENRHVQQSFLTMYDHAFTQKYPWIREAKKQQKWRKTYDSWRKMEVDWEAVQRNRSIWRIEPTANQLDYWMNNVPQSFWKKRKRLLEIKRFLGEKMDFQEHHLADWRHFLDIEAQRNKLLQTFHEFRIDDPDQENPGILQFLQNWQQAQSRLHALETSSEALQTALRATTNLGKCIACLKNVMNYDPKLQLIKIAELLAADTYANLLTEGSKWAQLGAIGLSVLAVADDLSTAESYVLKANWVKLERQFPDLVHWDGEQLLDQINRIEQAFEHEMATTIERIHYQKSCQFDQFHALLRSNPAQLDAEKRRLRLALKRGKALLVKQFAKSRNHLHIRELLQSDARPWIELLCPVWIGTPAEVSKQLPFETGMFDWCLIDEASQIPIGHVLGSLQRSKRLVIAGDDQQMPPTSYFTRAHYGHNALHQAKFQLPSHMLRHHYRSEHSALIAFSNRYFYDNQLHVFPTAHSAEKPLSLHFIDDAWYEEGQNEREAQAVAEWIEHNITRYPSLGVAAFSEKQTHLIWQKLSAKTQGIFEERIQANSSFFKPVEQIQGDECGVLIISLGYGRNTAGKFELRFGPLNSSHGSKRLNVLFSRARQAIHLFASVRASDFPLSNNEAVNLLKHYLHELEHPTDTQTLHFPFSLEPTVNGRQLTLHNIEEKIPDAHTLYTLISVLKRRSWNLVFA